MTSLDNPNNTNQPPDYDYIPKPVSSGQRRRQRSRTIYNRIPRQWRKYFRWRLFLITALTLTVLGGVWLSIIVTDTTKELRESLTGVTRVVNSVSNRDGTQLTLEDLEKLLSSLQLLQGQLQNTQSRIEMVQVVAQTNPDWQASVDMLQVAEQLTAAGVKLLQGTQPAFNFLITGSEDTIVSSRISSGERIVDLLNLGNGRFEEAAHNLRIAESVLNNIDYSEISSDLLLQLDQLRNYWQQLNSMTVLLQSTSDLLTQLLGLDEPRTYLVLAQNNDELRPSGGYISTYGYFTVNAGRITEYFYSPSTATNPNPPSADFLQTFSSPDWWLNFENPIYTAWDASWTPNFPTTAQMAMSYYNEGGNPRAPVDGVMAIDITGFEMLLAALEEVYVPSHNVTITPANFREAVYNVRAYGTDLLGHKQFVAAIYRAIFANWQSIDEERSPLLLDALLQAIQQRHLLLYFPDEASNQALQVLGWSGQLLPATTNDYLQIVDTNLGNKSNHSIQRNFTYDAILNNDASINSRFALSYSYLGTVAENDPAIDSDFHGPLDYNNLLQVYLPLGAVPTESTFPRYRILDDVNHTLLVTRFQVDYDSIARYELIYQTPNRIEELGAYRRYELVIQKQAGALSENVDITIRLPEGARYLNAEPEPTAIYNLEETVLEYRLNLDTDVSISVFFE